jgi:hypothetical protein
MIQLRQGYHLGFTKLISIKFLDNCCPQISKFQKLEILIRKRFTEIVNLTLGQSKYM